MAEPFDVTMVLNYYRPYVSGLTEAAAVVAEELAARGWRVAVVASRHESDLPLHEVVAGVEVHRAPVALRLGKGVISPQFLTTVRRLATQSRCLNLHLPMLEASAVARLAGSTPVVLTYQCDVNLSDRPLDRAIVRLLDASTRGAMRRSDAVIVSSMDYATSSRVAAALPPETFEISPPTKDRAGGRPELRDGTGLHVGFLGRIVEEKGLEYLVRAFRSNPDPEARLLVAGEHEKVAGGSVIERVRAAAAGDHRVRFLGFLPASALADFYASLDVFVLPSINSLEAFGIVQVEAMSAGVPVVASNLPGVRVPVERTGLGRLAEPRDVAGLAGAIADVIGRQEHEWTTARARARELYGLQQTVDRYEQALRSVLSPPP